MYVKDKSDSLIIEYQNFIKDTLFDDIWIYAKDLSNYIDYDSLELGRYWPGEIIISTAPLFIAYELNNLSKFKKSLYNETNRFVKSTIFHELTHHYVNQIGREMEFYDTIRINRAYENGFQILRNPNIFGATFIEEGICEYMVTQMGEIISPKKTYIPKTKQDLVSNNNKYNVVYKYSVHYLKTFLDTTGFKNGVKILLSNSPPSEDEILNPSLYFNRLNYLKYFENHVSNSKI